ncbi:hypothetical protein PSE_3499 [Pseudovibrio sp. FO-BEG1]|nr:hypothetical protein PSE_3499 [Pseudovibrio sp. FO-BEG1]
MWGAISSPVNCLCEDSNITGKSNPQNPRFLEISG